MGYEYPMTTTTPNSSDVRAWARKNGFEVGDRGRLSPTVLEAYRVAKGGAPGSKQVAAKKPAKKAAKASKPMKKAASRPVKKAAEPTTTPAPVPVATVDSARVESLEAQLQQLATRVERLEAARAAEAAKPKGLFRRS